MGAGTTLIIIPREARDPGALSPKYFEMYSCLNVFKPSADSQRKKVYGHNKRRTGVYFVSGQEEIGKWV